MAPQTQPQKNVPSIVALILLAAIGGGLWLVLGSAGFNPFRSASSNSKPIAAATWQGTYPFTVDGTLECEPPGAIILKANGNIYGINGAGQGKYKAVARPLEDIWKPNPDIPGSRIPLSDVLAEGQKLCQ